MIDLRKSMEVEKFYNEKRELAVLISPEGWSGCNYDGFAYDKRIVCKWLNEKPSSEEMEKFLESLGYTDIDMCGYDSLAIEYIPEGVTFRIVYNPDSPDRYGYEGIETFKTTDWMTA